MNSSCANAVVQELHTHSEGQQEMLAPEGGEQNAPTILEDSVQKDSDAIQTTTGTASDFGGGSVAPLVIPTDNSGNTGVSYLGSP